MDTFKIGESIRAFLMEECWKMNDFITSMHIYIGYSYLLRNKVNERITCKVKREALGRNESFAMSSEWCVCVQFVLCSSSIILAENQ